MAAATTAKVRTAAAAVSVWVCWLLSRYYCHILGYGDYSFAVVGAVSVAAFLSSHFACIDIAWIDFKRCPYSRSYLLLSASLASFVFFCPEVAACSTFSYTCAGACDTAFMLFLVFCRPSFIVDKLACWAPSGVWTCDFVMFIAAICSGRCFDRLFV